MADSIRGRSAAQPSRAAALLARTAWDPVRFAVYARPQDCRLHRFIRHRSRHAVMGAVLACRSGSGLCATRPGFWAGPGPSQARQVDTLLDSAGGRHFECARLYRIQAPDGHVRTRPVLTVRCLAAGAQWYAVPGPLQPVPPSLLSTPSDGTTALGRGSGLHDGAQLWDEVFEER